jgi:hypothetical protein
MWEWVTTIVLALGALWGVIMVGRAVHDWWRHR